MSQDKLDQAYLLGRLLPARTPNSQLRLDTLKLSSLRGEHALLGELILELERLRDQAVNMAMAGVDVVAIFKITRAIIEISLVAVDLSDPVMDFPGMERPTQEGNGESIDQGGEPKVSVGVDPNSKEFSDALLKAVEILKAYHAGYATSYNDVVKLISDSPLPSVTQHYVATAKPSWSPIKTAYAVVRWDGMDGIRAALPEDLEAGIDVRIGEFNHDKSSAQFEVLKVHKKSKAYASLFTCQIQGRKATQTANIAMEALKVPVGIAVSRQWPLRCAVSVCRTLLAPDKPAFVITEAYVFGKNRKAFGEEMQRLLDEASSPPAQVELWDPEEAPETQSPTNE